jgi:hypothetical protein
MGLLISRVVFKVYETIVKASVTFLKTAIIATIADSSLLRSFCDR